MKAPTLFYIVSCMVSFGLAVDAYVRLVHLRGGSLQQHVRHFVFLTQFNTIVTAVYYFSAFLRLSPASRGKSQPSTFFKRAFTLVLLVNTLVVLVYWSLFFYHRPLIHPKGHEMVYPWYLNIGQHAVICTLPWLELVFIHPSLLSAPLFGAHTSADLAMMGVFGGGVIGVFYGYSRFAGRWPYPFQNHMGLLGHSLFDGGLILFWLVAYFTIRRFQRAIWSARAAKRKTHVQ